MEWLIAPLVGAAVFAVYGMPYVTLEMAVVGAGLGGLADFFYAIFTQQI